MKKLLLTLFMTAISCPSFASLDEACYQKLQKAIVATYLTNVNANAEYKIKGGKYFPIGYFSDEKGNEIVDLVFEVSGIYQGYKADELFRKYKVQVFEKNCEAKYIKTLNY